MFIRGGSQQFQAAHLFIIYSIISMRRYKLGLLAMSIPDHVLNTLVDKIYCVKLKNIGVFLDLK